MKEKRVSISRRKHDGPFRYWPRYLNRFRYLLINPIPSFRKYFGDVLLDVYQDLSISQSYKAITKHVEETINKGKYCEWLAEDEAKNRVWAFMGTWQIYIPTYVPNRSLRQDFLKLVDVWLSIIESPIKSIRIYARDNACDVSIRSNQVVTSCLMFCGNKQIVRVSGGHTSHIRYTYADLCTYNCFLNLSGAMTGRSVWLSHCHPQVIERRR